MAETKRTPTNRELMAARQGQSPLTPPSAPAAPKPAEVPALRDTRQAVQEYNQNYRSRYLDEVAPAAIAGRLIKFSKEGDFVTTDDDQVIAADAEFIALVEELQIGWMKFNGAGEAPVRSWACFTMASCRRSGTPLATTIRRPGTWA